MMTILSPLLDVGYYLWLLFIMFLAYVTVLDSVERREIDKPTMYFCKAVLFPGYIIDLLVNWILMTVILWEPPRWKEWTVTKRASRHCHQGEGWRHKIGKAICRFLNKFQRGGHCRP